MTVAALAVQAWPSKIVSLAFAADALRHSRVVLAHGVFDLIHLGHVRYLEDAAAQGDALVVSVTPDEYVGKGPGRPVFTSGLRAEALAALACVDAVIVNHGHDSAENVIQALRPAVYAKGAEYRWGGGRIIEECAEVQRCGGRVHFHEGQTFSSSALINRHLDVAAPEALAYLERARGRGYARLVPELVDAIAGLSVLFIGETIIDEYVYVTPLGKPPKEFVLAALEGEREVFNGGVFAAAEHLKTFCAHVVTISTKSVRKTRFVDQATTRKLFEVYRGDVRDDSLAEPEVEAQLVDQITRLAPAFDLVVVTDFGHGMLTRKVRDAVVGAAKYLAVNTQSNAGNHGFNLIAKYPRAAFVCLDAPEARLAVGDQHADAEQLAAQLNSWGRDRVIVTDGRRGSVVISEGEPRRVPALGAHVVDTMGAGDAFLAVTAPLSMIATDMEAVAFVGNIVGAAKCGIVGHRSAVDKATVLRHCATMLK